MSLKIYDRYDHVLPDHLKDDIVRNIESEYSGLIDSETFKALSLEKFRLVADAVKSIDNVSFTETLQLQNREGKLINPDNLSTGCKGVLLLLLEKCKVLDTIELSKNALCHLLLNVQNGAVIMEPPYKWPIIKKAEGNKFVDIDPSTKVDIIWEDMYFKSVEELNNFIEYGED